MTTQRIRRFVDEYEANGFADQKKAALAAGYAQKSAAAAARRLLTHNTWVIKEVERRRGKAGGQSGEEACAGLDEVICLLSEIARANYCSFFEEGEDGAPRLKSFDRLTDSQQRQIKGTDKAGYPVLHDKLAAIRLLADLCGKRAEGESEAGGVVVLPEVEARA